MTILKNDLHTSRKIATFSNLNFAIFLVTFLSPLLLIWRTHISYFILIGGFFISFMICSALNIKSKKRISTKIYDGELEEFRSNSIKLTNLIIFPFIEVIVTTRYRSELWKRYIDQECDGLVKESEIWDKRMLLLDELKEDGFISEIEYSKKKLQYKEHIDNLKKAEGDN